MRKTSGEKRHRAYLGYVTLVLFFCFFIGGCATPKVPPSGFLSDYSKLKQDAKDPGISWWEAPNVPWKKYKKLKIDLAVIRIDPSKAGQEINDEKINKKEMALMGKRLRQAVIEAMKNHYPVVDSSGPDILRIRAALTHLKPVNPTANIFSTVLLGMPVDVGEAAVEVQFLDSQSGKVLLEIVAVKQGSHFDFSQVWTRWDQVEAAFKEWADQLRAALDEIHKR